MPLETLLSAGMAAGWVEVFWRVWVLSISFGSAGRSGRFVLSTLIFRQSLTCMIIRSMERLLWARGVNELYVVFDVVCKILTYENH